MDFDVSAQPRSFPPSGSRKIGETISASRAIVASVTPQQLYGHGECAENPQASCFDMNRFVSASGVSVPAFPFQNRPTFQQVVELTTTVGR